MKPQRRLPKDDDRIRLLPDSPQQIAQSISAIGYSEKLARVFREAIARAKRSK